MNYQQIDKRWGLILLVALLVTLLAFNSCNPYKQITKRSPQNAQDSGNLAKLCLQYFPTDTTGINIDSFWSSGHIIISDIDTTNKFNWISVDTNYRHQIDTVYKDTCTTAIQTYNDGFRIGYHIGWSLGEQSVPITIDTLTIIKTVAINNNAMSAKLNGDIAGINKELNKYKSRSNWKGIVCLVLAGLIILFLLIIYRLLVKKTSLI